MANSQKSSKRKNNLSFLKLTAGLLIFVVGIVLIFNKDTGNQLLSSSFENEPVKANELILNNEVTGDVPHRIIIPSLKINLEVKEANIVNGYWEVFEDTAGWGRGSAFPGQTGNQVIFAHARENLFLPLRSIKENEKIYVLAKDKYYLYEVREIKEVYANQTEVLKTTDDETLTLYTCSGFADSKRLIIAAKRIK